VTIIEQAVLTALPAGLVAPEVAKRVVGNRKAHLARVTAFVTPRIDVGAADVPVRDLEAFAMWPDTVAAWDLGVVVDGKPAKVYPYPERPAPDAELTPWPLKPSPLTPRNWRPAELWSRLFANAVVRTRVFNDLTRKALLTCPASEVDRIVSDLYARFTATTLPTEGTLAAIDLTHQEGHGIRGMAADSLAAELPVIQRRIENGEPGPAHDGLVLGLASRFYHRPEAERATPPGVALEDHLKDLVAAPPDYDFHQLCAAMGDYPLLLRALGLAVDLLVDEAVLATSGWVAIQPVGRAPVQLLQSAANLPHTRYLHGEGHFVAAHRVASRDPGIRHGMLHLGSHRLTTLDVDSAAPQVVQVLAAATTRQQVLADEGGAPPNAPVMVGAEIVKSFSPHGEDPSSLPALRTGGITLLRPGRGGVLAASLARSKKHELAVTHSKVPPELWADDVTRGWRLDVRDKLSKTQVGWLSLGARKGRYVFDGEQFDPGGEEFEAYVKSTSASTDSKKPEVLYTSECVAGWDGWSLAARRPGRVITPAGVEEPNDEPLAGFPLSVTFRPVPGSLPVLRFGRTYQLRARTADLAGNSHTLEGAPDGFESKSVVMTRWEPVLPPEVVPWHPFGEGESLLRVVLRSTRHFAPEDYVALDRVIKLPGHPKVSPSGADWSYQPTATRHLLAPKEAQQQAERHGGFDQAFLAGEDRADLWSLLEREAATFYDLPAALLVEQGKPEVKVGRPTVRGGELGPHRYLTSPQRLPTAPYLPDHLALGVAVHDLPGFDKPLRVDLASASHPWPDRRTALMEVVGGPLGARVDEDSGVVLVSLPQAEVLPIRLSSFFDQDALALLAVWERVLGAASEDEQLSRELPGLKVAALAGRLWTLTPWIHMTLVHAVEMPLEKPSLLLPGKRASRLEGETFASLAGRVKVHAKSTGRVDIDASWREPRDDIGLPPTIDPSTWASGAGHVGSFNVRPDENMAVLGRDEAGSTHGVRHELGDTRHRRVTYRTTATTRFRDYFPPEVTEDPSLITTSDDVQIVVPSSRRPDPPQVAYVVPTFGWDESTYASRRVRGKTWPPAFRRTRRGGGLRVYLRRPWWSSGAGERLAVVLPNQPAPTTSGDLANLLGRDAAAAEVDRVASALSEVLVEAGVRSASRPKLVRAFRQTEVAEGPQLHRKLLTSLQASVLGAGVEVAPSTFERAWGQVEALVGSGTGVVLPASTLVESERSTFVTRWGRDPTVVAGDPGLSPGISDFVDRDGYATGLSLPNPVGEGVAVATYEPQFDAERDLWFVDLHLAEHDHFLPFIRLALARYQKQAIPGCELSEVRVGDFMQLLPTREVTVRDFGGPTAHVTLRGRAGFGALALGREARTRVASSLHLRAWVEQHGTTSPTDLDWEPATDAETWLQLDRLGVGWMARWLGQVALPEPKRGLSYRLAVEEMQVHESDPNIVERDPDRFGFVTRAGGVRVPVGMRLLWMDRIDLAVVDGRLSPVDPEPRAKQVPRRQRIGPIS